LSGLSLTPLIDIVFLLLIFFLVATKFEEEEREMQVVLPQSAEAMPIVARPSELFVNVDQEGRFLVAGRHVDEDELLRVFQQAWADNPGRQTVVIRADERCVWKHVVAVMDLCNKANIRDYRVAAAGASG